MDLAHDAVVTCRRNICFGVGVEQQPGRVDVFPKAVFRAVIAQPFPKPYSSLAPPLLAPVPIRCLPSPPHAERGIGHRSRRDQLLAQGTLMDLVPGFSLGRFPWQGKGAGSCRPRAHTVILGAPWGSSPLPVQGRQHPCSGQVCQQAGTNSATESQTCLG